MSTLDPAPSGVDFAGTVVIVDDDMGLRDSLIDLFDGAGLESQGYDSAESFLDALDRGVVRACGCALVDVCLPGENGLTLLRRLLRVAPNFPVIMISGHSEVSMAVDALKTGAVDFIEKPFDPDRVLRIVRDAMNQCAEEQRSHAALEAVRARLELLTPREFEVADRMMAGCSNKEIAAYLGISPRTVELHRARVMKKMEVRTLAELVRLTVPMAGIRM
jgi:two-component system response regulator FixJ